MLSFKLHNLMFFCSMLPDENKPHIHILFTQKGEYMMFEYKTNYLV